MYILKKLSTLLNKDYNGIHEAALVVSSFTFVSQLLALLRERLLAGTFGAGLHLDMYYTAFRIPDIIFVAIASFFSFTILVPFFVKREHESHTAARDFLSSMFTLFCLLMIGVCLVAFFVMPWLVNTIAPGFDVGTTQQTIHLARILLLSPILLGLSNLLGTVTQSKRKFFVYALSPVLYNIGIISGIVFLYPIFGLAGLTYGVVIGALLHLFIQVPVIARLRYIPKVTFSIPWSTAKEVFQTSLPRTLTLAFSTISLVVLSSIATTIGPGSVAVFDLSKNLYTVPIALIGISFSVAAFPSLVALYEENKIAEFSRQVLISARHILFWSLPVMGLFIVLRAQIVRVIFGTGRFDWTDTRLTAAVLALFVISVAAHNVMLLLLRGYYAAGRTKKPLAIVGFGTALTIVLGYVFVHVARNASGFHEMLSQFLRIPEIAGGAVVMLPIAYTIGIIIICVMLWWHFVHDFPLPNKKDVISVTVLHSLFATIVMALVSYGGLQVFAGVFNLNNFFGIFGQGLCSGVLGIVAGTGVFMYLKTPEFQSLIVKSKNKILPLTNTPVYPEQEP